MPAFLNRALKLFMMVGCGVLTTPSNAHGARLADGWVRTSRSNMQASVLTALLLVLVTFAASASAQTYATNKFLQIQRGELPIILTAPHGGSLVIPGVPKRKGPEGERTSGKFVTGQDTRTFELAIATAKRIEEITGKKPYLVASKAHRQYMDPNRPEKEGVEHPKAQVVHAAFHAQVREFVDELRTKFPQGALLLDVHGQASSADTIFRGTQNGTTVMKMIEQHGVGALTGKHSILGYLAAKGISVSPANTPPGTPPETRDFAGGHIVRTYGSHTTSGVDAIQLEFGGSFRTDLKKCEETASGLRRPSRLTRRSISRRSRDPCRSALWSAVTRHRFPQATCRRRDSAAPRLEVALVARASTTLATT